MKVVIVGGTHGNEKTGIFLIQKYLKQSNNLPQQHTYHFCFGNPQAISCHRRFLDDDLNRSFGTNDGGKNSRERRRAEELRLELKTWANGDPFFLIDLHTSTAEMGTSLVLSKNDRLSARVIQEARAAIPGSQVIVNHEESKGQRFLESLAPHGLLLEIGPVAQNVFDPVAIQKTEAALMVLLTALHRLEHQSLSPVELEGYQEEGAFPYPRDEAGQVIACLHPQLIGKDFQEIKKGAPLFVSDCGNVLSYEGSETLYPIFIGEAAYMESGTAFMKAKKITKRI